MRRRHLLLGGLAVSASTTLSRFVAAQTLAAHLPAKIVDVHCHVFNADDLPMVEFIDKAFLRATFHKKKYAPYAPVIDAVLKDLAKRLNGAAGDEGKYLDAIKA